MRIIDSSAAAALSGQALGITMLVEMMLVVPVRLTTAPVDVTYGGDTYTGIGSLGEVESIENEPAGDNKSLRFSLSGVPSENIALALGEEIRGKAIRVRLAILHPDSQAILDAPIVWSGTLDQMPIQQAKDGTCTIAVTAEHRGATAGRPKPLRYTDVDQRRLSFGDTSLRFVVDQSQKQDVWPSAAFFRI